MAPDLFSFFYMCYERVLQDRNERLRSRNADHVDQTLGDEVEATIAAYPVLRGNKRSGLSKDRALVVGWSQSMRGMVNEPYVDGDNAVAMENFREAAEMNNEDNVNN